MEAWRADSSFGLVQSPAQPDPIDGSRPGSIAMNKTHREPARPADLTPIGLLMEGNKVQESLRLGKAATERSSEGPVQTPGGRAGACR